MASTRSTTSASTGRTTSSSTRTSRSSAPTSFVRRRRIRDLRDLRRERLNAQNPSGLRCRLARPGAYQIEEPFGDADGVLEGFSPRVAAVLAALGRVEYDQRAKGEAHGQAASVIELAHTVAAQ